MIPALEPFRPQVEALCRRHRVARLDVFGSALEASSLDECGDVDLLVIFRDMTPGDHAECYFDLLAGLERLFGTRVDLVEVRAIRNPYCHAEVENTRQPLCAA